MEFGIVSIIIGAVCFAIVGHLMGKQEDNSPIMLLPFLLGIACLVFGPAWIVSTYAVTLRHKQCQLACGGNLGYYDQDGKFQSSNNTILKMIEANK